MLELILASMGAKVGGLTGLVLGWLVAIGIEAILMFSTVFRVALGQEKQSSLVSFDSEVASLAVKNATLIDKDTNEM